VKTGFDLMGETNVNILQCTVISKNSLIINRIGSGVGVILYDREAKTGAGLHVLAPNSGTLNTKNPVMYANTAIPYAIGELEKQGAKGDMRLALAGGATMLGTNGKNVDVGAEVVNAIK
jgi:chemotaxis receptor (MCP) glutamine deamidase CheD